MKVLVIEDDPNTALALKRGLRTAGYDVSVARTGDAGEGLLQSDRFDAVLLDWMLPGRDGVEILAALRLRGSRTPVILLTARDTVDDRVVGLNAGADDYLVKPFAFEELLARLRALSRRTTAESRPTHRMGDLELDLPGRRVRRGTLEIVVTPREFDLLAYLFRHAGDIVTRSMIARDIWRETQRMTSLDNVIDVHMAHLRRKVEGGGTRLIHTVRGVGYTLREEAEAALAPVP